MASKLVNAINTATCSTQGTPYQVSGTGSAAFIQSCQDGSTYYFYAAFRDSCNGGSGSCFSIAGGQTDSYDTGTVSLTVNGTQVASASYGEGSTPSTLVSALISASSGNNLVNLTAGTCSGDTCNLTVTAQDDGTQTDYAYAVTVDDTSAFGGTSFANSASSGDLAGGTNVPLYNWAINSYAPDGDVLSMTDSVEGAWSYTYDDMNRVLTADASTGPDAGMDLTWAYDRYGNRWSQTATGSGGGGATQPSLTFNGNNNRADGYSYSGAGNLLSDGLNQYSYDGADRVLNVNNQAAGYVYDAEGNRVAKLGSGGSVQTVYVLTSSNQQLTELSGSGTWNHTNIYAPGGRLLATYDASGQPSAGYHYNLTDWLASKRMQTTAGGNSQETCISNPFGDGLSCTGGADATEAHFTGKDHDTESNLDYFGARYYSGTLGRFMTPDWAAAPAAVPYATYGDPQSLNLYVYVQNNPLTGIDATGHYGADDPSGNPENSTAEKQATTETERQSEASNAGSGGDSNSTGKSKKEVPGTNHTPGAPPKVSAPGSGKQPSGSGKTAGQTGQVGNHPEQKSNTNQKSNTGSQSAKGQQSASLSLAQKAKLAEIAGVGLLRMSNRMAGMPSCSTQRKEGELVGGLGGLMLVKDPEAGAAVMAAGTVITAASDLYIGCY